jgi:Flp pilus assembly protein TadD
MTIDEAFSMAVKFVQSGRLNEAEQIYRRIIELQPNSTTALNNLGSVLLRRHEFEEAIAACQEALKIQPEFPEAHINLSQAYLATGRVEEAIDALRRTLAIRPDLTEGWNNLGNAYLVTDQLDKALEAFHRALALQPGWPHVHSNLGKARQTANDLDGAIASFRAALALQPDLPITHLNLGIALLLRGEYLEGWREYEWRWRTREFDVQKRNFAKPHWDGSELNGRRILLFAEQGFGDTIQFVRYAKLVADRGGEVVLECQPQLCRLLRGARGVTEVARPGLELPAFDTHCPLLSLARIFGTELTTIPAAVPYNSVDKEMVGKWKARLAPDQSKLKVGLAWAGGTSDRNRSLPLKLLLPLAQIPGVSLYSLQYGAEARQIEDSGMPIQNGKMSANFEDFADTAGLISQLDLVVTIDTAVAHLAGSMGKPVWVLLKFAPDWRWLLDRADSPWYPTMRLFRQKRFSEWESPIRQAVEALSVFKNAPVK